MTEAEEIRADAQKGARRLESEFKAPLVRIAMNLGLDPSAAEALAYDTMSEAVRSIASYDERDRFFPWLAKIMTNIHAKATRRRENDGVSYVADVPEPADAADASRIFDSVDSGILKSAVEELPADMKEAVVLHYFLDLPVLKIAKILSIPAGTVKSRLHYARVLLARRLGTGGKIIMALVLLAALAGCAIATVRLVRRTFYWRPGTTMARFDEPRNWSVEGPGGRAAGGIPGADANLAGGGDYSFDMSGGAGRVLGGWETPDDWDNHYLVVANGSLRFSGDVATHTGELAIEDGGELTFLEGSTYTPAIFSAGKWVTRVKKGGVFNLFGSFKGYSYRIVVEEGGEATLRPQFWGGAKASEQADNTVENSGHLRLPAGLEWRRGGSSAERYSVVIRQNGGILELGGGIRKSPVVKNLMRLEIDLAGGRVAVSGDVSFAADEAHLVSGVEFSLSRGARLDLSTFTVDDGARLKFTGEGEVILPAGRYALVEADGAAVKTRCGAEIREKALRNGGSIVEAGATGAGSAKVLKGPERLVVDGVVEFAGGLETVSGDDGSVPEIEIRPDGILRIPGGACISSARLHVKGRLEAFGEGDLLLGCAKAGETARFSISVEGGTLAAESGDIDFFTAGKGGRVVQSGDVRFDNATIATTPRHGVNFGRGNPPDERIDACFTNSVLRYAAGSFRIAGGARLHFGAGAGILRPDEATELGDLVVKDAAQLFFAKGAILQYGASANAFGSVGNGGLSFIPAADGYPALVIDGAEFWYHHPNAIRGANMATLCVTNAIYELKKPTWNWTMPFEGFKEVKVGGSLKIRLGDGGGTIEWDGKGDPREIKRVPEGGRE